MRPPEDKELDEQLRDAFRRHADDLVFTRSMQDRVLSAIAQKEGLGDGRRKRSLKQRLARRSRVWTVGISSAAACLLLAAWGVASWQQAQTAHLAAGSLKAGMYSPAQLQSSVHGPAVNNSAVHGNVMFSGPMQQAAADIPASLAPVESQDLTLTPGITQEALQQQSAASGTATKQSSGTGGAGAGHTGTAVTKDSTTRGFVPSTAQNGPATFVQLARQEFTVSTRLYNTSDKPLPGASLQGMLFILKQPSGLTPDVEADWEYFVDGPKTVIPAHQSVPWTFTPNPAPPYKNLGDRTAHLIWMFRSPNPSYPTLYLGTLPVRVTQVHLQVTGNSNTAVPTQFLRVTARLTNQGTTMWDIRSALGMLFFARTPGASLLSRETYKYFDDIAPVGRSSYLLRPGQSSEVQFIITGVPGTDMRQLPLTILLVARNQIGA